MALTEFQRRLCRLIAEKELVVTERAAARELNRWDLLVGWVAPEEDGTLLLVGNADSAGPGLRESREEG